MKIQTSKMSKKVKNQCQEYILDFVLKRNQAKNCSAMFVMIQPHIILHCANFDPKYDNR